MPDNEAERPTTAPPNPPLPTRHPLPEIRRVIRPPPAPRKHRYGPNASAPTDQPAQGWCGDARPAACRRATRPPRRSRARPDAASIARPPQPGRGRDAARAASGLSTERTERNAPATALRRQHASRRRAATAVQTGASDGPAAARRPSCNRRLTRAVARPRVSRTARAIERWAKTHRPSSRLPPAWGNRSNCRQDVGHHSALPGPTVMRWPAAQPIERWERVRAVPSTRLQARLQELPSTGPWVAHRYRFTFTARSHRCTRATPPRTAASPRDRRRGPHAVAVCAALPSGPAPVAPTRPHTATTRLHVARSLPRHGAVISATPPVIPAHAVIQALGSE